MPDISGFDTAVELKKNPETANARSQEPVITETKKENYDGVCPNCMNGALAGCHCHPQNWNPNPNDDPLARQAMRNQRFQNAISKKIQERYNLSQKAAHHFGNESMKDKLINAQIKNEFKLNIPSKDVLRQRAMQRYNKNEEILNRGVVKFENLEVEEFYANESGNCVTDGSVCAIGNKKYYNKYLPTLDTYKKFLDDQINARQSKKLNERENDKKLEREIYEKNQRDQEKYRQGTEEITCTCTKSNCNKKYCECYKTDKKCNDNCRCINCFNKKDGNSPIEVSNKERRKKNKNQDTFIMERISVLIERGVITIEKKIIEIKTSVESKEKNSTRLLQHKRPRVLFHMDSTA